RRHTSFSRDWSSDVCSSDLGTNEVQGISFEKDGVKFKGSAIDRKFSFASMEKQLSHNRGTEISQSTTLADRIREVLGQQEQRSRSEERSVWKESRTRWWPYH